MPAKGVVMSVKTQMHFARQGTITPEMRRVAEREQLSPELMCDEVARGRLVIPANVNHLAQRLDPMAIGQVASVKINANIGNSAVESNIDQELEKLHHAVHYGADTVMDLSTGGDIDAIRQAIVHASPVPTGTVPIYEAVTPGKQGRDSTADAHADSGGPEDASVGAGCGGDDRRAGRHADALDRGERPEGEGDLSRGAVLHPGTPRDRHRAGLRPHHVGHRRRDDWLVRG